MLVINDITAGYFPFSPPYIILKPAFLYSLSSTHEIEIKWGNCHKNWMKNNNIAKELTLSVAATYPNINGIAPGIAPTNIDIVDILLRGVYRTT